MAYLLFVDESGQDHRESPYEVLAGIAVEDRDLWNLVRAIQDSEMRHFGVRYTTGGRELKAKKLLNRGVFRQAARLPAFDSIERRTLAGQCLGSGETAGMREMTALAQAKLAYVHDVLRICLDHRCKAIASIILDPSMPRVHPDLLRRDYCYLFERYYYWLEQQEVQPMGLVVFDELEKSRSHLLLWQMARYFQTTAKGLRRAALVVPEPFFVHSDLTTGVQLADLVAYILSWGFRLPKMVKPAREELAQYAKDVVEMEFKIDHGDDARSNKYTLSFAVINKLVTEKSTSTSTTKKAM